MCAEAGKDPARLEKGANRLSDCKSPCGVATRRKPSSGVLCRSSIVQLSMQSKDLHSCPHVDHHKQALSHIIGA